MDHYNVVYYIQIPDGQQKSSTSFSVTRCALSILVRPSVHVINLARTKFQIALLPIPGQIVDREPAFRGQHLDVALLEGLSKKDIERVYDIPISHKISYVYDIVGIWTVLANRTYYFVFDIPYNIVCSYEIVDFCTVLANRNKRFCKQFLTSKYISHAMSHSNIDIIQSYIAMTHNVIALSATHISIVRYCLWILPTTS
jgi:hypothetical protein